MIEEQPVGTRVSFEPGPSNDLHFVATLSSARSVDRLEADTFHSTPRLTDGAEYVVIAPQEMIDPALDLAALREASGLSSYVLTLEDLHDEFAAGIADPWAIRTFLAWATENWNIPPRYVVLAGRGTYDPKDYLGMGDNVITPVFAATPYGMAAADNLLADIDGDRIPDVAIGRLPVATGDDLAAYVAKVEGYEAASGAWLRDAMMLADDPDSAGNFTLQSETAAEHLPADMTVEKIYLEQTDIESARASMIEGLQAGRRIVNYIGHGGVELLAAEQLMMTSDVASLGHTGRPAAISALTCIAGRYEYPNMDSLSEALVAAEDGGAVAMWAPTSPSISGAALGLNRKYLDNLFLPGARMGDAILTAIQDSAPGTLQFLLETYTLMGDPALRVQ